MSKALNFKRLSAVGSVFTYPFLISLFFLLFFPLTASAAQAVLGWSASSSQAAGYDVHYGAASGNYTTTLNVGNVTTATLQNLASKTCYIALSAYDANNNQSPLSSELVIDSITASAGSGGTISPSGSFFQAQGASQSFTITPASGYVISKVLVDGTSVGAVGSYTLSNISASHTVSATFAASTSPVAPPSGSYTISASAGPNGTISPAGSISVNSGGSKTFAVTPTPGYSIAAVLVDGSSVGPVSSYTFSDVAANHSISATFGGATVQSSYRITATAGQNGSISPSGSVTVGAGAAQSFSITPAAGYQVASVVVDGTSLGALNSYTFNKVEANQTISASFTAATAGPVADAGPNQTMLDGGKVTLSASNSTDVGGPGMASYHWVQTGGPTVTLATPSQITSALSVPSKPTALTFELTATDKNGVSSTSTCIVDSSYWYTTTPGANAGEDQTTGAGSAVELNGAASTGPLGDSSDRIETYLWQQLDGPAVKLSNSASPTPTFTAPKATNGYTSLCFMLTVTDTLGLKASDFCFVNVSPSASASSAPKAVVGPQQSATAGKVVKLNGSGSTASSGIVSYRWRQTSGIPVTLSDPTSATPTFTAALYPKT
ncbi:MAG: PKD domain-containing protein, partial [Syntrophobacteraceae bacterium]